MTTATPTPQSNTRGSEGNTSIDVGWLVESYSKHLYGRVVDIAHEPNLGSVLHIEWDDPYEPVEVMWFSEYEPIVWDKDSVLIRGAGHSVVFSAPPPLIHRCSDVVEDTLCDSA